MNRDFKGVWIPKEIFLDDRLTAIEKMLLVEIDSLSNCEEGCYASNEYFASFLQTSEATVKRGISKLRELGYVYTDNFDGRKRYLKTNMNMKIGQNDITDSSKRSSRQVKMSWHNGQNDPLLNTYNNIVINKKYKKENDSCESENVENELEVHRKEMKVIADLYTESGKKSYPSEALKEYIRWKKGKSVNGKKVKYTNMQIYDGVRRYIYEQNEQGFTDTRYWKKLSTLINNINVYVEINERCDE